MLTEVLSQEPNLTYAYRIQNTDVMHSIWKSPKILHLSFSILPFPTIFVQLIFTCLVALFDRKL